MKPTVYLGVDPGGKGAVARIWPDGIVEIDALADTTPKRAKQLASISVGIRCADYSIDASIERLLPYEPGRNGKPLAPRQAMSLGLQMGQGFGETLACMWYAQIWPVRRIANATWRSKLCKGLGKGKEASIRAAELLYPGIDLTRPAGTKPDDNFADALLIAECGRMLAAEELANVTF